MMEEQYEEQEAPYPVSQPMPMFGHTSEGALQYQLESKEEVGHIIHAIKGEEEAMMANGRKGWIKTQKPMVNDRGFTVIKGYLNTYLNSTKTFALTDLDDDYIREEVIDVGRTLKAELMDNWTEYEVKDFASASFIVQQVAAIVNAVLRKGQDATYLKFLRTTQSIQEVQHHQQMGGAMPQRQEKKGILDTIFGKRR